jgi:hypothetical protein
VKKIEHAKSKKFGLSPGEQQLFSGAFGAFKGSEISISAARARQI